jgi:tetratricopeptide (TPR) repeat protein
MAIRRPFSLTGWVGSITALFSLIAGIYGGWAFISDRLEKRRAVDRLLATEAEQLRRSDYEQAWNTLVQAAQIDANSARVQQAQEDVAMQWLDHISTSGDETFASIAGKLEPVLTRGATSAKLPQRQADLLAHVGWSYFLRGREVPSSPDPEPVYRDALLKDTANPYGHAMLGHWILWNHQGLAKAKEQFAAALAAPRPELRPYVRSMQLSALNNDGSHEGAAEMVRVANDIRKEHGDLDPRWPRAILNIYSAYIVSPNEDKAAFLSAVPPADHLDTFDWLVRMDGAGDSGSLANAYIRGVLLEGAGRRDEALAEYRKLQGRFGADDRSTLAEDTRKAIGRLGGAK